MLGAVIQMVTVFDTRRGTVSRRTRRALTSGCTKTGPNTLIAPVARIGLTSTMRR